MSTHISVSLVADADYKHKLQMIALSKRMTLGQYLRSILDSQLGANLEHAPDFFVESGQKFIRTDNKSHA